MWWTYNFTLGIAEDLEMTVNEENTAREMIIIFAQEQYSLEGKGVAMLTTLLHEPFKQLY